jgi:hypothetical protein
MNIQLSAAAAVALTAAVAESVRPACAERSHLKGAEAASLLRLDGEGTSYSVDGIGVSPTPGASWAMGLVGLTAVRRWSR